MRSFGRSLLALCGLTMIAPLVADDATNERDIQAVEQFVKTKRAIFVKEKGGDLSISGDVRFEYKHAKEEIDGLKQRGGGSGAYSLPMGTGKNGCMTKGTNEFDVEANLYFDYVAERTWASIKVEFDNNAGISAECSSPDGTTKQNCGSGACDSICLETAYMGYRVYDYDDGEVAAEIGRRNMYTIFDSRVQFVSRCDGVVFRWTHNFDEIANVVLKTGVFVIDEVLDQYGFVGEVAVSNILETGLELKYSYIDWVKGHDRCGRNDSEAAGSDGATVAPCLRAWDFRISQFSAAYILEDVYGQPLKVYGAILLNHAADRRIATNGKKKNLAWYVGAKWGKVKHQNDWSVDANFQWVEAQSVPDFDVSGVGRGNAGKRCFTGAGTAALARGNANYLGWQVEGLYALTDNVSIDLEAEGSVEEDSSIGGDLKHRKLEAELIYAF